MSSPRVLFGTLIVACLAACGVSSCTDLVEVSPFPCASDGTCPIDLSCFNGECVKSCSIDTDCLGGRICSGGQCRVECETEDDCHEGESCAGVCFRGGPVAVCGNFTCEAGETCESCPGDCPTCATCGNFSCEAGETCESCSTDCGGCTQECGDLFCDSAVFEDCTNCAVDCGQCAGSCTLFGGQCPGDQTCIITGNTEAGSTVCDLVGGKQLGEPCFLQECGYNAVCWGIDPNFVCTQECDNFNPCPFGSCTYVNPLPNGGGVCLQF